MILHLGVIDLPYAPTPVRAKNTGRRKARAIGPHKAHAARYRNITTGDVAGFLENRYHVMEHYWQLHQQDAAKALENSLLGSVESLMMGAPVTHDPYGSLVSAVEDGFKQMLSQKELEGRGYPGIPTRAALEGVSHRFKHAYKRRPPRPSFIDTGLYQASFKAWITG